eukprot:TRINITY_DN12088_c0_g1_i5.p1 TRINITY_DN12088_c0_g1~~TRINITY_DN12088_c0_g1_i5.p1  ORF type:complete len:468 (-),score=53.64 TRINITY_DN12088_c0_g1_i5:50-1453(-)
MVTELDDCLFWAPGLPRYDGGGALERDIRRSCGHVFRVRDCDEDERLRGGRYSVSHYPDVGTFATGPLALDQTMQFCHLLATLIEKRGRVVVATEPQDLAERANVAVMLGAFCALRWSWDEGRITAALPNEADICFPSSWHCDDHVLSVRCCWAGICLARDRSWLPTELLCDPLASALLCDQYSRLLLEYDASVLVPGKVIVCADPMTVIKDPNPRTCSELFSTQTEEAEETMEQLLQHIDNMVTSGALGVSDDLSDTDTSSSGSTEGPLNARFGGTAHSASSSAATAPRWAPFHGDKFNFGGDTKSENTEIGAAYDVRSLGCNTVCKRYVSSSHKDSEPRKRPASFVNWCLLQDVRLFIRLNTCSEPGLSERGGSYARETIQASGIVHLDMPMPDIGSGIPEPQMVLHFLNHAYSHDEGQLLLHCKVGFVEHSSALPRMHWLKGVGKAACIFATVSQATRAASGVA